MNRDGWEPVSPVRQAWENGGRQYYEQRTRPPAPAPAVSVIDYNGQMDVCTPVRRRYATSPGYTPREQEHLVRSGMLDVGLQPPAGWREPQLAQQPERRPAVRSWQFVDQLEEWRPPAAVEPAKETIVYAQYRPEYDPDLQPQPVRAARPKAAPVQAPPPAPVEDPVVCEPVTTQEEEQLVVTPTGFGRYTAERFGHLEIKR